MGSQTVTQTRSFTKLKICDNMRNMKRLSKASKMMDMSV
jgi:hypothetical protein